MAEALGSARSAGGSSLSFQQASELNSRKDVLKSEHTQYVKEHPELKDIMSDFLSQVLLAKPADIRAFAKDYFAAYLPSEMGKLQPLCLAGPSGVGKGTLVKRLFAEFGDSFGLSVSHTTREPRENEVCGKHYHFCNVDEMRVQIDQGDFIEHAEVHGNLYGTSVKAVEDVCKAGKVCILEIDIQGVKAVKETSLRPHTIYIAPPSVEELETRLRGRGSESEEDVATRLRNAKEEMDWLENPANVDRKIVNDDLDRAYEELKSVLAEIYPSVFAPAEEDATGESKE